MLLNFTFLPISDKLFKISGNMTMRTKNNFTSFINTKPKIVSDGMTKLYIATWLLLVFRLELGSKSLFFCLVK